MDQRNSAPSKTKLPPPKESDGESEEDSETSDEETEDEEQAEGGSEYESESDKSTDTKKKLIGILPTKQQSAIKASVPATPAAPGSPAKRTREVNGKKDKEDEPPSKKKKPEVATPAAKSAAPKPTAPQSGKKESASKAKPSTAAKEKPLKDSTAEKDPRKSIKKKPQSPAAKSDASRPSKSTSEGETPLKTAKPSRPWSPEEELLLSKEIQKDRVYDTYGANLPAARADPYWEKLISRLSFMDKYEKEYRVERLCEKVRRMRLRYDNLFTRIKAGESNVWKNDHEGKLWRIWHTIWGPLKATPGMLNGDDEEEEEEDDESEEDEEEDEEEDDEDEIEPTQTKERQSSAAAASAAQKKALSRKKAQSSSDDDGSNKEEAPVKATPPAVLATPTAAGKQPSASKSLSTKEPAKEPAKDPAKEPAKDPAKNPAPTEMELDLNTSGKDTSQRAAVHNGAQGAPAVASAPKVVVNDELRAENLAFLRDMRGTCVKMVEEAKTQSLLIYERMLEETRAKTTQIVEEAREKSSQIMEELRIVAERLAAIAGQNGRTNGSGISYTENPFQGGCLLGNGVTGDHSQLEGRWREQSEAEQGLLLQRLQLVQEQARVEQEGIRLNLAKLNLQKQQQAKSQDKA